MANANVIATAPPMLLLRVIYSPNPCRRIAIARDPSSHAHMGADTLFDQQGSPLSESAEVPYPRSWAEDQRNCNIRIVDNFSSLDNTLPELAWDLMLYIDVANPEAINISEQSPSRRCAHPNRSWITHHPEVGRTFWEISGFAGSIVALIGIITGYPGSLAALAGQHKQAANPFRRQSISGQVPGA